MKGCNYIRGLIDEADKPEMLPLEANDHISRCGQCEMFANERTRLRGLLASGTRVTAPMNFDAMLNARLAQTRERGAFSWLSPAGYLRLGAATAVLLVMVFAAQQAGLFSDVSKLGQQAKEVATGPAPVETTQGKASPAPVPAPAQRETATSAGQEPVRVALVGSRIPRSVRSAVASSEPVTPAGYSAGDESGVVLLRGSNGSADVPMPTVSVGAQPMLYVSAGQRQPRSAVGTSF